MAIPVKEASQKQQARAGFDSSEREKLLAT
jgi:hypothetical protein